MLNLGLFQKVNCWGETTIKDFIHGRRHDNNDDHYVLACCAATRENRIIPREWGDRIHAGGALTPAHEIVRIDRNEIF